jgi:hypothetical protein
MIKADWLAAGVLLVSISVELVIIKYVGKELANYSSQWEAKSCCPV